MIRKTYMILELKQNVRFKNCTLDIDTDEKKLRVDCLTCFQKTIEQVQEKLLWNSVLKNCSDIESEKSRSRCPRKYFQSNGESQISFD